MFSTQLNKSFSLEISKTSLKYWGVILSIAALTALSSKLYVALAFSPVPITFQSFAVILAALLLKPREATFSMLALIFMAASGLPVFASPLPGWAVLAGPTGGYIFGFVLCAGLGSLMFRKFENSNFLTQYFVIFFASLLIFIPGVFWLKFYTGNHLGAAITIGFVPFLIGDLIKCALALICYRAFRRFEKRS